MCCVCTTYTLEIFTENSLEFEDNYRTNNCESTHYSFQAESADGQKKHDKYRKRASVIDKLLGRDKVRCNIF